MAHINVTNRPEFAAYLNMALHNCYKIMKHITIVTGCTDEYIKKTQGKGGTEIINRLPFEQGTLKDACILDPCELPVESEKRETLKKLLLHHFPMLDPFLKKEKDLITKEYYADKQKKNRNISLSIHELYPYTLEDMVKCLKKVFTVLTYYRDMSSHTIFNDARSNDEKFAVMERDVTNMLHFSMTVACRIVKTRFDLDNESLKFFTENKTYRRFIMKKVDGKQMPVPNLKFPHSMSLNLCEHNGIVVLENISEKGLIYLTCMFLERKYARMFLDSLAGFYNICKSDVADIEVARKRWLFEIYILYRAELPRIKLDSTKNRQANAMDMLNELKKCPSELFEVLTKEDQKRFEVNSSTGERVLLKRHSDRFAPMAMRWLDDKKVFDTLRFNVKFGKYHYVFCDQKHCADGLVRVRSIVKDLNGFGRLTEIEDRRVGEKNVWEDQPEVWNGSGMIRPFCNFQPDAPEMEPYITDMHTCYLIDNNKIGLYEGNYMPDIKEGNKVENKMPHYWLNLYDLPGMAFYAFLYGMLDDKGKKKFQSPQNVITAYGTKYTKLFEALKDGTLLEMSSLGDVEEAVKKNYGLDWSDVPKKVRYILKNETRTDFENSANRALSDELDYTEKRLDRYEKDLNDAKKNLGKDNKMGKKKYVDIRPGRLAAFLAADIVKYMPYTKPSDKPTGLNYRVMQTALAMFAKPEDVDGVKRIFNSLNLLDGECRHPFLYKVLACNPVNVLDFYSTYLTRKKWYLRNNVISENKNYGLIVSGKKNTDPKYKFKAKLIRRIPFLNASRTKWNYSEGENYRVLAEHYLSMPLLLPKALYEWPIKKLLLSKYGEEMADVLSAENPNQNTAYMIQQFMKKVRRDDSQEFYSYARSKYALYKLLGKEYDEKELDTIEDIDVKMERSKKDFKDSELAIRRYKTQDMVLFLMAQDMILSENAESKFFVLRDVMPQGHGILDESLESVDFTFRLIRPVLNEALSTKKKKVYENVIYNIVVHYHDVKIKDWSKMMTLLYDWRIQNPKSSLLMQMPKDTTKKVYNLECDYETLEQELKNFDENRVGTFKLILGLENYLVSEIKKDPKKWSKIENARVDFAKILETYHKEDCMEAYCMSQVRNSMCHNQYPLFGEIGIEELNLPDLVILMKNVFKKNAKNYKEGVFTPKK